MANRTSMHRERLFLFLLIPSILLNIILVGNRTATQPRGTKVIGVIDGDTLVLEGKEKVRLRQLDAPETGLCGSQEATAELERLSIGKYVRIDEIVPDHQGGRGMALVYDGDTVINLQLIKSGWVRYHSDKTSQTEAMKQASQKAKEEKRGIYGTCVSTENTKNPECIIKGNIDKNTYTDNKKYYFPGCAQYNTAVVEEDLGEQWFCTEKEAQNAGFVKAATCK